MITLTRLNDELITVNAYQVESLESGTDTIVTMMNGKRLFVKESLEEVQDIIEQWFLKIHGTSSGEDR